MKRFRISVIIEAENMVSADAKFKEITKNSIEATQITMLPQREIIERLKKKLGKAVLESLDMDLLEALFGSHSLL